MASDGIVDMIKVPIIRFSVDNIFAGVCEVGIVELLKSGCCAVKWTLSRSHFPALHKIYTNYSIISPYSPSPGSF